MNALTILRSLGPIDSRVIRRDSMLRWMLFMPLLMGLIYRFGIPWLSQAILSQFNIDLTPYLALIYSILVLLTPVLFGTMIGFLFLDERDDGTLTALQVTPITLNGYLGYRLGLPVALSILLLPPTFWLAGLTSFSLPEMLLLSIVAAPLAPLYTLFMGVFATNKVQGFAIVKASGVFIILPLVAYFVYMPWQLIFGLLPTYWPLKVYWLLDAGQSGAWIFILVGLAYQLLLISVLLRRFNRVMRR